MLIIIWTPFNWEPGKKYTYTIDLAGCGYHETNIDANEDLDPILEGSIIKFVNVTVDSWTDYDGDAETEGTQPINIGM